MKAWLMVAFLLLGCPTPKQFVVQRPGLTCDRATRVAYRTMIALGYTVTSVAPADQVHPGDIIGTKPSADGRGVDTGRVVIRCGADGATIEPIEEALFPTFEFSRGFDYSFKALVQQPEAEAPSGGGQGLEVLVKMMTADQAILDLDGVPTVAGTIAVRVTVRNHTDRAVVVDPASIDLVPANGEAAGPLAGTARSAALTGSAGERVQQELLKSGKIAPQETRTGYVIYPAAPYREARISIEDAETGETEGFVTPVQ